MNFDNSIKTAFIISVLFHSFLIFAWPAISILLPKKPAHNFEVTYYRIKDYKSEIKKIEQPLEPKIPAKAQVQRREKLLVAAQKKIQQAKENHKTKPVQKPGPVKPSLNQNVVIPPLPAGVEKIPGYLDYVQSVRENIKKIANSRFSNQGLVGDVMLHFVLLNDGTLSAVKIVVERSSQDPKLHNIGRLVIESASPFGQFPQDLEYNQLSFSVVISFE